MNFKNLITKHIDDRFCYIQYDEFELIMMKENNFINATKLCKLGGKKFYKWLENESSKDLIKEVEEINKIWKIKSTKSSPPNSGQMILEIKNESKGKNQYEVSGSYVHQDLIPHIASWIDSSFAVKVSKIINCFVSKEYEFKLKDKEDKIDKLQRTLEENNEHIKDLKSYYREQRKGLKRDFRRFEIKYDNDTRDLKDEISKLRTLMKDRIIKPTNSNKLACFLVLQDKENINKFKIFRIQKEKINHIKQKHSNDYNLFYESYEPNAISYYNTLKEKGKEVIDSKYSNLILKDLDPKSLKDELKILDNTRYY